MERTIPVSCATSFEEFGRPFDMAGGPRTNMYDASATGSQAENLEEGGNTVNLWERQIEARAIRSMLSLGR